MTYKAAGVNVRAAEKIVQRISSKARATFSQKVLSEIGSFGAFYDARFRGYKRPGWYSSGSWTQ